MSLMSDNLPRLLIANRGEISCRIIKTAKKMGLVTIAVYSDADCDALHTTMADQSIYIGESPPAKSYLNINSILEAAQQSNADMIHPGYGFLSENAAFAQNCLEKNIRFIGPSPQAITDMGSKSRAKAIMSSAGVPIIPGYHGQNQSEEHLIVEAAKIGYPLLIKAASGGGGKGMRIVNDAHDLKQSIASARREAVSSFGDPTLLLEAFLPNARHVEVQVLFDNSGHGIYLFDRDCSLQRRHQKVIEEAPAPELSADIRQAMGEAAIAAGSAIGYEGAGTVEFMLADDLFYFMEVNTRLQVEHPVTEYITRLDLVEWQIKIALGEPLPIQQESLCCHGHAVEARVYAENPAKNFLPSAGRLTHLEWPEQSACIRVDSGVQQGDFINSWYDPMLAKVIAWGETRKDAINKLIEALEATYLAGLNSNRDYLLALLHHSDFLKGNLSTSFIQEHFEQGQANLTQLQKKQLLSIAALYRYYTEAYTIADIALASDAIYPCYFYLDGDEYCIKIQGNSSDYLLIFNDEPYDIKVILEKEKKGSSGFLEIDNIVKKCRIIPLPDQRLGVFLSDCSTIVGLPGSQVCASNQHSGIIKAPMNGTITAVNVSSGATVTAGSPLLTMEAMKMEYTLKAPHDGILDTVALQPGDQVESGIVLIAYKEDSNVSD